MEALAALGFESFELNNFSGLSHLFGPIKQPSYIIQTLIWYGLCFVSFIHSRLHLRLYIFKLMGDLVIYSLKDERVYS